MRWNIKSFISRDIMINTMNLSVTNSSHCKQNIKSNKIKHDFKNKNIDREETTFKNYNPLENYETLGIFIVLIFQPPSSPR